MPRVKARSETKLRQVVLRSFLSLQLRLVIFFLQRSLERTHRLRMCCIAPVIAAHVLKATVTVGEAEGAKWPYGGTVGAVEAYGGTHQAAPFDGVCVDAENMVVTSPAYMYEGQPHEVFDSVGVMVSETLRLQTLQVSERLR